MSGFLLEIKSISSLMLYTELVAIGASNRLAFDLRTCPNVLLEGIWNLSTSLGSLEKLRSWMTDSHSTRYVRMYLPPTDVQTLLMSTVLVIETVEAMA
eukprot:scaffold4204_cov140-Cylindrotheca_fusiformis.AAC.1